jgi:hypothetical protein
MVSLDGGGFKPAALGQRNRGIRKIRGSAALRRRLADIEHECRERSTSIVYQRNPTVKPRAQRSPTLKMDEIYAALLYFEIHRETCLEKLTDELDASRRNMEAHAQDSRATMERLRQRKMERAGTAGA